MKIIDYIYQQPEALKRVFDDIPEQVFSLLNAVFSQSRVGSICLVGSGTSRNALISVEPLMIDLLRRNVVVRGPTSFMKSKFTNANETLAIFMSQSGASKSTVDAVDYARSAGVQTIVITAEADSSIAQNRGPKIILPIGQEQVGPKTKGYTASVAALICFAVECAKLASKSAPSNERLYSTAMGFCNGLQSALAEMEEFGHQLAGACRSKEHIMFTGQNRHLGTALEASLKLVEISGNPSVALDTEEALHGHFHGLDELRPVFFITGSADETNDALNALQTLKEYKIKGHVFPAAMDAETTADWVGKSDDIALEFQKITQTIIKDTAGMHPLRELDLISTIIPFQFFAVKTAQLRGMIPEHMRHPNLSKKLGIKIDAAG